MRGDSIVNTPRIIVHRLLVAAWCSVATLLIPHVAQAECPRTDIDGDGLHDRIASSTGPAELAVRLAAIGHWHRLQAGDLIVKFVVTDLDRDGDPDLITSSRRSGLRVWINKGRGLFTSSRSRQLKTPRFRLVTRRPRHSVRGVQSVRWDDSALNDPTRLLIVWSAPPRAHLVALCPTPAAACVAVPDLTADRPTPRGPPLAFS